MVVAFGVDCCLWLWWIAGVYVWCGLLVWNLLRMRWFGVVVIALCLQWFNVCGDCYACCLLFWWVLFALLGLWSLRHVQRILCIALFALCRWGLRSGLCFALTCCVVYDVVLVFGDCGLLWVYMFVFGFGLRRDCAWLLFVFCVLIAFRGLWVVLRFSVRL